MRSPKLDARNPGEVAMAGEREFDKAGREVFLARPLVAVYAVGAETGRIHATPVWYLYEGGRFTVLVLRGSPKHRHSERARRAAICIEDSAAGELAYLTAEGPVEILDPVELETRLRLWNRYTGPERAAEVVRNGLHERQVALRLSPETWIGRVAS